MSDKVCQIIECPTVNLVEGPCDPQTCPDVIQFKNKGIYETAMAMPIHNGVFRDPERRLAKKRGTE